MEGTVSDWGSQVINDHTGNYDWPLMNPDLEPLLEYLKEHPNLKCVRQVIQDEPEVNSILQKAFNRGFADLTEYSLMHKRCGSSWYRRKMATGYLWR